jgi:rubrerythrin
MILKGTQTEKNLMIAFSAESKNTNRYSYYATIAKQEGYIQVARSFKEISGHEKEHARKLFKLLNGASVIINEGAIMSAFGSTEDNLKTAIECEKEEQHVFYSKFAKTAKEEVFGRISKVFNAIYNSEQHHELVFKSLLKQMGDGSFFKSADPSIWKCSNCGYYSDSMSDAPFRCPACSSEQAHFEVIDLEYKILDKKPN